MDDEHFIAEKYSTQVKTKAKGEKKKACVENEMTLIEIYAAPRKLRLVILFHFHALSIFFPFWMNVQ